MIDAVQKWNDSRVADAVGWRELETIPLSARYLTRSVAPLIAGATLRGALGAPFLIAGALKSVYDLGLYMFFRNVQVEGERTAKPAAAG